MCELWSHGTGNVFHPVPHFSPCREPVMPTPDNLSVCGEARALAHPGVGSEPQGSRQWAALIDTTKLLLSFSSKNGRCLPGKLTIHTGCCRGGHVGMGHAQLCVPFFLVPVIGPNPRVYGCGHGLLGCPSAGGEGAQPGTSPVALLSLGPAHLSGLPGCGLSSNPAPPPSPSAVGTLRPG